MSGADLHERFRHADEIEAPDAWGEVNARAARIADGLSPERPDPGGSARRVEAAIVALLVFATAGAFAWRAFSRSTVPPGSARGDISRITLPSTPFGRPVIVGGSAWLLAGADLFRVSTTTETVDRIPLDGVPSWVSEDAGSLWVTVCTAGGGVGTCSEGVVERLDPSDGRVIASFPAGRDPTRVLADGHSLWVVDLAGPILRIDATTGEVRQRILAGECCRGLIPVDLALSSGLLWVEDSNSAVLLRIDPSVPGTYPTIGGVTACDVVGDDTAVWAASCDYLSNEQQTVWRIDPGSASATPVLTVDGNPHLGLGGGAVWIASYRPDGKTVEIHQLDPQTGAELDSPIVVPDDPAVDWEGRMMGALTGPQGPYVTFGSGYLWLASEQDGELIRVGIR